MSLQNLLDAKKAPATREAYRFAVGKFVHTLYGDGGIEQLVDCYLVELPEA